MSSSLSSPPVLFVEFLATNRMFFFGNVRSEPSKMMVVSRAVADFCLGRNFRDAKRSFLGEKTM